MIACSNPVNIYDDRLVVIYCWNRSFTDKILHEDSVLNMVHQVCCAAAMAKQRNCVPFCSPVLCSCLSALEGTTCVSTGINEDLIWQFLTYGTQKNQTKNKQRKNVDINLYSKYQFWWLA